MFYKSQNYPLYELRKLLSCVFDDSEKPPDSRLTEDPEVEVVVP